MIQQFGILMGGILFTAFRKKEAATRLSIDSNGESGWHYGLLDAPELGPLLDSLAARSPK